VNAESPDNLFAAIEAGDVARVDALLRARSALANARNAGGITPLLTAVYYGKREIADLLLRAGAEIDLFAAAALGQTARLDALLREQSARVFAHSADGWTALPLAADDGDVELVEALLARGAEVNPREEKGKTPLALAVAAGHGEAADLLRRHGGKE